MTVDRSLRAPRAAVFSAVCVSVSAVGHVWMSGPAIPAWALCAAVLATGTVGFALAGRRRGFAPIAGLMLLGELGLHLLFTAAQRAADGTVASMPGMPGMSGMPGMVMPQSAMTTPIPGSAPWGVGAPSVLDETAPTGWMSAHHSVGMIAVHVAAGLLSAWWLWRGEAAVLRLLGLLAQRAVPPRVVAPRAPVVPDRAPAVPRDTHGHAPTGRRVLVHAVVRRGPPTPVACL